MTLEQFIVKAKISAYANENNRNKAVLADGSKEICFSEGKYVYQDRYYGWNPFVGEEIIWESGRVVWAMNYYGKVVDDTVLPKDVYALLRKAMMLVKEDRPFRGPFRLIEGIYMYRDKSIGTVDIFKGTEIIYRNDEEVYRLEYHGGRVDPEG